MSTPYCKPCLDLGHQCPAIDVIWKPDEIPMCAFCEDRVPCPVMQRSVDPVLREKRPTPPKVCGGEDRAGSRRVDLNPPAQIKKVEVAKMSTNVATVKCRHPECASQIGQMKAQQTGCCNHHYYWGINNPRNGVEPQIAVARPAASVVDRPARKVAAPANKRRTPNGGTSRLLQLNRFEDPRKSYPRSDPANGYSSGAGELVLSTLLVSEKQIDAMFAAWSLEDKTACIQMFLVRSAQG